MKKLNRGSIIKEINREVQVLQDSDSIDFEWKRRNETKVHIKSQKCRIGNFWSIQRNKVWFGLKVHMHGNCQSPVKFYNIS